MPVSILGQKSKDSTLRGPIDTTTDDLVTRLPAVSNLPESHVFDEAGVPLKGTVVFGDESIDTRRRRRRRKGRDRCGGETIGTVIRDQTSQDAEVTHEGLCRLAHQLVGEWSQ